MSKELIISIIIGIIWSIRGCSSEGFVSNTNRQMFSSTADVRQSKNTFLLVFFLLHALFLRALLPVVVCRGRGSPPLPFTNAAACAFLPLFNKKKSSASSAFRHFSAVKQLEVQTERRAAVSPRMKVQKAPRASGTKCWARIKRWFSPAGKLQQT